MTLGEWCNTRVAACDWVNQRLVVEIPYSRKQKHLLLFCTFMRWGHLTCDPWIWLKVTSMASTASNRKSAKTQYNSGFLMIHSTLRDQDGNIIISKCFDEMRLLRSLRLLRFLMVGKSPSIILSARSFWFFEAKEAVEFGPTLTAHQPRFLAPTYNWPP